MAKTIKCPHCASTNFEVLGEGRKKMSVGKGLVGGALLGPLGAVAGGAVLGKKGGFEMLCNNCKRRWVEKKL